MTRDAIPRVKGKDSRLHAVQCSLAVQRGSMALQARKGSAGGGCKSDDKMAAPPIVALVPSKLARPGLHLQLHYITLLIS